MKALKYTLAATSFALLAACGGGGGVDTANNPLSKYVGTYYICDGHSKETVSVTALGSNSISLSYLEEIYQNVNCTGPIVGTYRMPQAVTATYESQTTANFPPVTLLPNAGTVERVSLSSPGMTAQLSGSGVSGSCVNYSGGNVCYSNLVLPPVNTTGATYLSGNYFVTFSLENGVLEADGIYSKESSFNSNMLISD
jgi:hypothetical protein